jgi:hypothetical protein
MRRKVDRSVLTGAAGLGVVAVALGTLPGIPSANQQRKSDARAVEAPAASDRVHAAPASKTPVAVPADPSFERYRRLLELNPFSPRLPKKAPVVPPVSVEPPVPVLPLVGPPVTAKPPETAPPAAPAKPPEPPDPLKDWVYSGTVAIGGDVYAVLENKSSKQGRYLKAGDVLEGATIENVAQTELALTWNGAPRTLAKSSAFNATPLNGSGGGQPNPGGAPGQPAQPGGPRGPVPPGGAPPAAPSGGPAARRGAPIVAPASPGAVLSAPTPAPR